MFRVFLSYLVLGFPMFLVDAFSPMHARPVCHRRQLTQAHFGNWGRPKEVDVSDEEEVEKKEKPGITLQGILELVALGAGAPNLGKFTGVDKKTGTLNFELEKNTFTSKITGKTQNSFDNRDGEYFNEGYVDEDADVMGKIMKFFGGGDKNE